MEENKKLFQYWQKRLRYAKEVHKEKMVEWAEKILKEYSGDTKLNLETGERYRQLAQVIMSVEETVQPHLYFQNPTFFAKARYTKSEWEKREPFAADIVNYEYKDIKRSGHRIDLENELAILDARLLPFGVTKTTYEVEGGFVALPEIDPQTKELEMPVITKEKGQYTRRIDPLKVYLDYNAKHISKGRFVIEEIDVSRSDLKSPRYRQDVVEKLEPSALLIPNYNLLNKKQQDELLRDPDVTAFRIYEIHDLENRVIHTIANGAEDFLEEGTPYPLAEGSQYSFLWFIECPNSPYPLPPIKFYRQRANEFSYIYSSVQEQIDKFLPKIFIDMDRLDETEKEKLKNGTLGALVGVHGGTANVAQEFSPRIQGDLLNYMAMIKELMNLESGTNDYEMAVPEERKATEAKLIQAGSRARRFKPQKRVKGFVLNQAHTIFECVMKNAPIEHFERVLGKENAFEWWNDPATGKLQWTDENLSADFWFDYDIESIAPQNEMERRQQDLEILSTLMNPGLYEKLKAEGGEIQLSPVIKRIAKDRWKIRDEPQIIKPLNLLRPEQEHDLWMQGQFPPINPKEDILAHFRGHQVWLKSPAFPTLPPEIQAGAIQHFKSYAPYIDQIERMNQAKEASKTPAVNIQQNAPKLRTETPLDAQMRGGM